MRLVDVYNAYDYLRLSYADLQQTHHRLAQSPTDNFKGPTRFPWQSAPFQAAATHPRPPGIP